MAGQVECREGRQRQRNWGGAARASAVPGQIGRRGTETVVRIVVGENTRPGGGDVEERVEEVSKLAAGSKGREGIAERVEASLEFRAVLRVEGVEPAAAGEEPVARLAGNKSRVSDQRNKTTRILCVRQSR